MKKLVIKENLKSLNFRKTNGNIGCGRNIIWSEMALVNPPDEFIKNDNLSNMNDSYSLAKKG